MKKVKIVLTVVVALAIVLYIFHTPILRVMGSYLAPTSNEHADVVVIEGVQIIEKSMLKAGVRLVGEGRTDRVIVVLQQPTREAAVPLLPDDYPKLVLQELQQIGLPAGKGEVISVPIESHPVTLTEARFVTARLSDRKLSSAILLAKGFHTRRSYTLYKQEGTKHNLHVYPCPFLGEYDAASWWTDRQGISDFLSESFKFTYYIATGYIAISSL